jgi:hypothetical protein
MTSIHRARRAGRWALVFVSAAVLSMGALAQGSPGSAAKPAKSTKATAKPAAQARVPLLIEQRAIDLIKATSARLAAAQAMSFTAIVDIEYPSKLGPPLAYPVRYDVAMARPDKLRVLQSGAGAANEFYYDGKAILAYVPEANLVAVADAPPTIEAALKFALDKAAIYYPFMDLLLPDPYAVMTDKVLHAFYIGPSGAVGGVPTEAVAWATNDVFIQMWVGTEDKLPRRIRAMFAADPLKLRHDMQLSNWQLDVKHAPETFASQKAQNAPRIPFAKPVAVEPPPPGKAAPKSAKPAASAPKTKTP